MNKYYLCMQIILKQQCKILSKITQLKNLQKIMKWNHYNNMWKEIIKNEIK